MKHYELTDETMVWEGRTLRRIRRLRDGRLGGWVESESNLIQGSKAWVDEAAIVCDDAQVGGNAYVFGFAKVVGTVKIFDGLVYGSIELGDKKC